MRGLTTLLLFVAVFPYFVTAQSNFELLQVSAPSEPEVEVDILVEAETYTPYFYSGRAEPATGSTVTLVAILENGRDPSGLSFKWSVNRQTTEVSSSESISVRLPNNNQVLVELVVTDGNGNLIATKNKFLEMSEPQVRFYEVNTLRGKSRVAMWGDHYATANDLSIEVSPYFFSIQPNATNLLNAWYFNRTRIDDGTWNSLSLNISEIDRAEFEVGYSLDNTLQLDQRAYEEVRIISNI